MQGNLGKDTVRDLETKGAEMAILIMDDDSTTAAHVRNAIPHQLTKLGDSMHVEIISSTNCTNCRKTRQI